VIGETVATINGAPAPLEQRVLNAIFDAGGQLMLSDLCAQIDARLHDIRKILWRQATLGNLRRVDDDEPIYMTSSARTAIAAGRAHHPRITLKFEGMANG